MTKRRNVSIAARLLHLGLVAAGAAALTAAFFLVLPFIQAISKPPSADTLIRTVDATNLPPPPPPEEEPEKEEEKPEEEPPKLAEEAPPLDLAQLELALNPGFSSGWSTGELGAQLGRVAADPGESQALFSLADLDQKPRAIYQPSPVLNAELRKKLPGTVHVLFIVDERGRVESPIAQRSTDPAFERPALAAVKDWKFEPGKRSGKPVRFRMRVPITFPEGR